MHVTTRNVNTAFRTIIEEFIAGEKEWAGAPPVTRRPSRNGDVLMIDEPVTVTYTHPRERVLFNPARDANPFLHLYEALWMLAGRNDVAPLAYYAKQFREYSDDGETLNGAYGYRWRQASVPDDMNYERYEYDDIPRQTFTGVDQLDVIVNHLKADPNSRRAVLQMWNVEDDLLKIGGGNCMKCGNGRQIRVNKDGVEDFAPLRYTDQLVKCPHCAGSKDVCCNLSVMFSLRPNDYERTVGGLPGLHNHILDMTVTNRSNDLIWGLLGANYVHFSFLQEYMAARLGAEVGKYHHFTNNLHAYSWNWKPDEWLAADRTEYHEPTSEYTQAPLVRDPAAFDREVKDFAERHSKDAFFNDYSEPFLRDVAQPMCIAHHHRKRGSMDVAIRAASCIQDEAWRLAATEWLERRRNRAQARTE